MLALWGNEGSERRTGPDVAFYNVIAYGQEKKLRGKHGERTTSPAQ